MFKVTEQDSCNSEIEVSIVLCILQDIVVIAILKNTIKKTPCTILLSVLQHLTHNCLSLYSHVVLKKYMVRLAGHS
jgi:hypothetical protein